MLCAVQCDEVCGQLTTDNCALPWCVCSRPSLPSWTRSKRDCSTCEWATGTSVGSKPEGGGGAGWGHQQQPGSCVPEAPKVVARTSHGLCCAVRCRAFYRFQTSSPYTMLISGTGHAGAAVYYPARTHVCAAASQQLTAVLHQNTPAWPAVSK